MFNVSTNLLHLLYKVNIYLIEFLYFSQIETPLKGAILVFESTLLIGIGYMMM